MRCRRDRGKIETIRVVRRLGGGFCAAHAWLENTLGSISAAIRPLVNNGVPISEGDTGRLIMVAGREIDDVGASWAGSGRDRQRTIIDGIGVLIHGHPSVSRSRAGKSRHFPIGSPSGLASVITITRQPSALNRCPNLRQSITAGIVSIKGCSHRRVHLNTAHMHFVRVGVNVVIGRTMIDITAGKIRRQHRIRVQ